MIFLKKMRDFYEKDKVYVMIHLQAKKKYFS